MSCSYGSSTLSPLPDTIAYYNPLERHVGISAAGMDAPKCLAPYLRTMNIFWMVQFPEDMLRPLIIAEGVSC